MTEMITVRKDDLQLLLSGLDEHWITYPEHRLAIERLHQTMRNAVPTVTVSSPTLCHDPGSSDAMLQTGYYAYDRSR